MIIHISISVEKQVSKETSLLLVIQKQVEHIATSCLK